MTIQNDKTGLADFIPVTPMQNVPLWRQSILLYGEPKIGKTTFCSHFPNAVFYDAESGTMGIDVPTFENLIPPKDRISDPISTWPEVLKATSVLEGAVGKGYAGVIVIDTVQEAFDTCRRHVLRGLSIDHETDLGYGKGWRAVKDEFGMWVKRLNDTGFGIIFVGHQDEKEIKKPDATFQKVVPRMDAGPRGIVEPFVNLILYAQTIRIGGKDCRVLHTKGQYNMTAGERGLAPRLQPMLPFDYDCLQRNWDGEQIDLNSYFGFGEPLAAPLAMVPPAETNEAAARPADLESAPRDAVAAVSLAFDAK
jgi:hypothetical protein